MKRLYIVIPVAILAVLIGWRLSQKRAESANQGRQRAARMGAPAAVTVALARRQDVVRRFEYVGSVQAPLSVQIAPKVTGRIDYLQVREGDRVGRGQVLVRIDPSDVEAQVQQQQAALAQARYRLAEAQLTQNPTNVSVTSQISEQEAAVASAKADVKTAQANLDNARARYTRISALYDKGFVAQQDVDDARTAQGVQQAAVEAAEAKVKQAEAGLAYARANRAQGPAYEQSLAALREEVAAARAGLMNAEAKRRDTVLTSPLDGYVTGRYLDPGAVASPGQPILIVQYMRQVWVTVSVPEEVSGRIHSGIPAEVTLDALAGRVFTGRVTQVNPSADPQSRQFSVRVTLDNPEALIKPGTFAHVVFETDRVPDAVVVPREAVQRGKDGPYVVVVDGGDVAHPRPVKLGAEDTNVIAVTGGLSPGEKVVTVSAFPLKDGQNVTLGGEKGRGRGGRTGEARR